MNKFEEDAKLLNSIKHLIKINSTILNNANSVEERDINLYEYFRDNFEDIDNIMFLYEEISLMYCEDVKNEIYGVILPAIQDEANDYLENELIEIRIGLNY